mmetsp:Transcript_4086/g.8674  ORF Transcript_4086/g.8674 Transcript_4086/m.8674 type:complete len:290 (-) Transcript_4086:46-915(-)
MRLLSAAASAILGASFLHKDALAFAPSSTFSSSHDIPLPTSLSRQTSRHSHIVVSMSKGKGKKKLSVADIMAGGNKKVQQDGPGEVKASDNFSEEILADMQSCLQKLEKRAKGGPGTLDSSEVSDFEAAMGRVVADMDSKLQQGAPSPAAAAPAVDIGASTAGKGFASETVHTAAADAPASPPPPSAETANPPVITDTSLDEGPAYTGKGGLGMAQGTRSTYVIPGMEEMSGEEYRKALQKSVSDRQEERRRARGGVVGNRAAHSYLNELGWGGASGSLAADSGEDRDE